MNYSNGFTSQYYYTVVDPITWRDIGTYDLTGGSITKSTDSLMESADISLTDRPSAVETWVRIWLEARQGESGGREALFTGLLQIPATQWDGTRDNFNAQCYSVLKPADDILLPQGWYATAGANGAELAAELLAVGAAPVEYDDSSPTLSGYIVAENNESNLSMAWKIVNAIGWRIRINGEGTIRICKKATDPSAVFDSVENDIVELSITDTQDWFSCPNVLQASSGGKTATARDDDPDSPLSTVSRGREIWRAEHDVHLSNYESIDEYTSRRLKELQTPSRQISYARRYQPDIVPGDLVELHLPAQDIEGIYRVKKQRIELGYAARITEDVEFERSYR